MGARIGVSRATRLWAGQLRNCASISGSGSSVSVLQSVQTGSGIHPVSYSVGTRSTFPRVK